MSWIPNARLILKSTREYKCYACGYNIPKKSTYLRYVATDDNGKWHELTLCPECGFLMTCLSKDIRKLKENCFDEIHIPNCLRKWRTKFRENPRGCIHEKGLDAPLPTKALRVETLNVPASINVKHQQFFAIPYRLRHFHGLGKGDTLRIRQGNEVRVKTILSSCIVSRKSAGIIGRNERVLWIRAN